MFKQSAGLTRKEDLDLEQDNKALDRMPLSQTPITPIGSQYKIEKSRAFAQGHSPLSDFISK